MNKSSRLVILTILSFFTLFSVNVFADGEDTRADFSVEGKKHSAQINDEVGYFHLHKDNIGDEPIYLTVYNSSAKEEKFIVDFYIARTNKNGVIVYDDESFGPNDSLPYNIQDYIKYAEQQISVPGNTKKEIKIDIDTSEIEEINGILMGAFRVYKERKIDNTKGIGNNFVYELGLIISDRKDFELPNSERLDLRNARTGLDGGRKFLMYDLLNLEANIARNLKIITELEDDKGKTVVKNEKTGYSIAPNGTLVNYVDFGILDIKPGNYKLKVNVNDGLKEWLWNLDLNIDGEVANYLNTQAKNKVIIPQNQFFIFLLLSFLTIINKSILYKKTKS